MDFIRTPLPIINPSTPSTNKKLFFYNGVFFPAFLAKGRDFLVFEKEPSTLHSSYPAIFACAEWVDEIIHRHRSRNDQMADLNLLTHRYFTHGSK